VTFRFFTDGIASGGNITADIAREVRMPMTAPDGLRRVAARLNPDAAPDGELLARFLDHRDEAAFATLVRRHAAMVLGTCRRVLGNAADADDAFQAAFVVLVRKARGLTGRANVGNYLYGIAFHTALKAKAMAATRRTREARATPPEPRPDQSELLAALDEELAKLPEKYRGAVVLCELEGRSRKEAAEALGVPEGTLSSRLTAAHKTLERRLRSRGFAGVVLAAVFAGQRGTAADSLAEAAVRAVLAPSPAVSKLASEVTKMTLLHKLGIGTAALALVVGLGAAVVAGMAPTQPTDPPKPPAPAVALAPVAAPVPAAPEPEWKVEFRKAYGLKDGELVRRIAPPYPECRAEYFKDRTRELSKRSKTDPPAEDYTNYFTKFGWKDGWTVSWETSRIVPVKPDEGVRLVQLLQMTTGFRRTRIDSDDEVLEPRVTGDWVVRSGADPEKLAAQLETILRKECNLKVSVAVKDAERDVYVFSGKYESKPVPDRKKDFIEIFARELSDRDTGGGGSGSLQEMADYVEGFVEAPVVLGKIEGTPKLVEWHYNTRSVFTKEQHAEDHDPTAVLTNVGTQTGLTVKLEKRTIKVLAVKKDP
jgi:RNA polymerase sigma factor (sigma-70 family)